MKYIISLTPIPQWARSELASDINEKIERDGLDAKIPESDFDRMVHGDLPGDLYIEGAAIVLAGLIPFIHNWLVKRRIKCEIKQENGVTSITISGYDPKRVIRVMKMIDEEGNE